MLEGLTHLQNIESKLRAELGASVMDPLRQSLTILLDHLEQQGT